VQKDSEFMNSTTLAKVTAAKDLRLVAIAGLAVLCASFQSNRRGLSDQLEKLAASAFARHASGGVVLVAKDDRVIFRRAYGMANVELGVPMRPDHVLGTGSITRQFTAAAILQLVTQGALSLADDVRKHLPKAETQGRVMSIEQVLTHTAGLPNIVDRSDFETLARQDYSPDELLRLTKDLPLHFEPGAGYRYSDSGYFLPGMIIERVSGLSYKDYLETRLFRPLGMRDTVCADDARILPRRAQGHSVRDGALVNAASISLTVPYAAGAVFSTVDDLLRWDVALRAGKVCRLTC
jgi:CubicO group peptidase (beta-lactamase class C family)